jgi:hypothetical protein
MRTFRTEGESFRLSARIRPAVDIMASGHVNRADSPLVALTKKSTDPEPSIHGQMQTFVISVLVSAD